MAETRKTVLKRRFVGSKNPAEDSPRADVDVEKIIFTFEENGEIREVHLSDFSDGILRAAAAFGLNTSLGNAVNTAKSEAGEGVEPTATERIGAFDDRLAGLKAGTWSAERAEGGPRMGVFREALVDYRAANKAPVDDASIEAVLAKVAASDDLKKNFLKDEVFAAYYKAVQARKATEAASAAQAKASGKASQNAELLS